MRDLAPERTDTASAASLARTAAVLDVPAPTSAVPPLWHWTMFPAAIATGDLGHDGHPSDPEGLPPPPHPRRMFAGGRLRWTAPVPIDVPVTRSTEAGAVRHTEGRSGPLAFVTVTHTYRVDGAVVLREEQDLVYRPAAPADGGAAGGPNGPRSAPGTDGDDRRAPDRGSDPAATSERAPDLQRRRTAGPVLLFRYSAATGNAHRIHYDLPYATEVERHPGLVVHGPLLATWLAELVREVADPADVEAFAFRALAPAHADDVVDLLAWRRDDGVVDLEARRGDRTVVSASATLRGEARPW